MDTGREVGAMGRLPSGRRGLKLGGRMSEIDWDASPPFGEAWIEMGI